MSDIDKVIEKLKDIEEKARSEFRRIIVLYADGECSLSGMTFHQGKFDGVGDALREVLKLKQGLEAGYE